MSRIWVKHWARTTDSLLLDVYWVIKQRRNLAATCDKLWQSKQQESVPALSPTHLSNCPVCSLCFQRQFCWKLLLSSQISSWSLSGSLQGIEFPPLQSERNTGKTMLINPLRALNNWMGIWKVWGIKKRNTSSPAAAMCSHYILLPVFKCYNSSTADPLRACTLQSWSHMSSC